MRPSLEDLLLEEGLLDEVVLRKVRQFARRTGVSLARAAVEEGAVEGEQLAEVVARRLRLPRVSLAQEPIDDDAVREVPYQLADARRLLPLSFDRDAQRRVIRVAMADPLDIDAVEEIEITTGCTVEALVGTVGEIAAAVQKNYRGMVTKMIPRGGEATSEQRSDASPQAMIMALVDVLSDRGLIDHDSFERALKDRVDSGEGDE